MEDFVLVTDSLENASSSLNTLESKVSDLASSIEGYDTNSDGEFDFGTAKRVIANNMSSCAIKIMNTVRVLQNVNDSHTKLQKSLKFGEAEPTTESESGSSEDTTSSSNATSSSDNTSSSDTTSYSGESNSNTATTSSDSDNEKTSGATVINSSSSSDEFKNLTGLDDGDTVAATTLGVAGVSGVATSSYIDKLMDRQKLRNVGKNPTKLNNDNLIDFYNPTVINNEEIKSAGMATIIEDNLESASKKFFNSNIIELDGGLVMTGNRYIISCDSSLGKVGDIIRITKTDGSVIECIVGIETSDTINPINLLVVDKNKITSENKEFCSKLLTDNVKIEKYTRNDFSKYWRARYE